MKAARTVRSQVCATDQAQESARKLSRMLADGAPADAQSVWEGLGPMHGKSLRLIQNEALRDALHAHGAKVSPSDSGRQALVKVSRANRDCLSASLGPVELTPRMEEAKSLIGQLDFLFIHNSRWLDHRPALPILSARRLANLGMKGGANTAEFNSSFMKTDDNVFFYFYPYRQGRESSLKLNPTEYGGQSICVEQNFAKKHGWVSWFVMYPRELKEFARYNAREPFRKLSAGPELTELTLPEFVERSPGLVESVRNQLHQFDFTPEDFRGLVQDHLSSNLARLEKVDSRAFKRALRTLRSGDSEELFSMLSEHVFNPMGLPYGMTAFEAKVPVGVPKEVIRSTDAFKGEQRTGLRGWLQSWTSG